MAFGTGGIRGRTIGRITTDVEIGTPGPQETPEHAAAGTNVLNDFNIIKATIGLFRYTKYLAESGRHDLHFIIAHDVRHYSRHFVNSASTWCKLGGQASFSKARLYATAQFLGASVQCDLWRGDHCQPQPFP